MGWVTDDGGAMDRVAVFCAVLLGLCAATMLVTTVVNRIWVGTALWGVVLVASAAVLVSARRRIRGADPGADPQ